MVETGFEVTLSAGWKHTCVLLDNQSVVCSGLNSNGALGDGSETDSSDPVQIDTTADGAITSVVTGNQFGCAMVSDGPLCWGSNTYGQLGDGSTTSRFSPVSVGGLTYSIETSPIAIDAGDSHACAIRQEGSTFCWGRNIDGQLGDGTTT